VPDTRLTQLAEIINPQNIQPTTIEIVDIAGLIKGASKGEGLGNQFLANIREVNAIVHVVRCFENGDIIHVDGSVDPVRDKDIIDTELQLKDMETLEKRVSYWEKMTKGGNKAAIHAVELMRDLLKFVEKGQSARAYLKNVSSEDDLLLIHECQLLTAKPIIYVCNVEDTATLSGNNHTARFLEAVKGEDAEVLYVSAAIEADISELDTYEERMEFLSEMGLTEPGVNRVIHACYRLLDLVTYFTAGVKEVRAWTIRKGTKGPQAAAVIHTDFEKNFIRAKTVAFEEFVRCRGWKGAQEAGVMRQEGKEYIVQDGDLLEFLTSA
jgi:ribosome-binding ATPase